MIRVFHKLMIALYFGVVGFFVISVYIFTFKPIPRDNRCQGDSRESCLYEENRRSIQHLIVGDRSSEKRNHSLRSVAGKVEDDPDFDQDYFWEENEEGNLQHLQPLNAIISDEGAKESRGAKRKEFKPAPLVDRDYGLFDGSGPRQHRNGNDLSSHGQRERNGTNASKKKVVSNFNSNRSAIRRFPPVYHPVLPNGVDCSKVWRGDVDEVLRARVDLNDTLAARRPPSFYRTITEKCERYRQENGYATQRTGFMLVVFFHFHVLFSSSLYINQNTQEVKKNAIYSQDYRQNKVQMFGKSIYTFSSL